MIRSMAMNCKVCGKVIARDGAAAHSNITYEICEACVIHLSDTPSNSGILEAIDAPILLMQGNPRQVVTANTRALKLFGKALSEVESHRGGQVFDCIHSFSEVGCGKDINCENCKIKDAIVDTFNTANPHHGVSASLQIKKAAMIKPYALQVSTEKVGDLALVRIEQYNNDV